MELWWKLNFYIDWCSLWVSIDVYICRAQLYSTKASSELWDWFKSTREWEALSCSIGSRTKVQVDKSLSKQIFCSNYFFCLHYSKYYILNYEGQDSKTVYSFARIDFCSKYIGFALLKLLSTRTFVLLPLKATLVFIYGPKLGHLEGDICKVVYFSSTLACGFET